MSQIITSQNLDEVIKINESIRNDISRFVNDTNRRLNTIGVLSPDKLAFKILKDNHLIQIPIEDKHFGGVIYNKGNVRVPVINTAQPRVYQHFVAWHEIYHLYHDLNLNEEVHKIQINLELNERMADLYAAEMILESIYSYYISLDDDNFFDRIMRCMDTYKAPYKAILIKLFECGLASNNHELCKDILKNFDNSTDDLVPKFEALCLDIELLKPSNIIDLGDLEKTIVKSINENPDVNYHKDNFIFFQAIKKNVKDILED